MKKEKSVSYPAVRAWGKMFGSYAYYIDDQVAKAEKDKAPELAIYKHEDGWSTLDQVNNKETQWYFVQHYPELAEKAGFIKQ